MDKRILNEIEQITPRNGAEERMFDHILQKAENSELVKELNKPERKFPWKIVTTVAACLAVVAGIAVAVNTFSQKLPVQSSSPAEIKAVMITNDPEGNEYRSLDNGESWTVNGEPTDEKPDIYLTAASIEPYVYTEVPEVYLHNNTEKMLTPSMLWRLEIFSDGAWQQPEFIHEMQASIGYTVHAGDTLTHAIPLYSLVPKAGRYRCYLPETDTDGYTCMMEFYLNVSSETAVMRSTDPEGKEYISYDNGETWLCDGKLSDAAPQVHFTTGTLKPIEFTDKTGIQLVNHGDDIGIGIDYKVQILSDGEWVAPELLDPEAIYLVHDIGYILQKDDPFSIADNPLTRYVPCAGRYRVIKELHNGFTCTAEFTVYTESRTTVLTTTDPDGKEYKSYDNGLTWYVNGWKYIKENTVAKPPVYLTLPNNKPLRSDKNALATVHCSDNKDYSLSTYDLHQKINGEWADPHFSDPDFEQAYSIFIQPLFYFSKDTAITEIIPLERCIPSDDKYMYTVKVNDSSGGKYTCTAEFYTDRLTEFPAPDENAPTITTTLADGTVYSTCDNGLSWTKNGSLTNESPEVFFTTPIDGVITEESNAPISLHNFSGSALSLSGAGVKIQNDNDWTEPLVGVTPEYLSYPVNDDRILSSSAANHLCAEYPSYKPYMQGTYQISVTATKTDSPEERFMCTIEYKAALSEGTEKAAVLYITKPTQNEFISTNGGASWTVGGKTAINGNPPLYITADIREAITDFSKEPLVTLYNDTQQSVSITSTELQVYSFGEWITPEAASDSAAEKLKQQLNKSIAAGDNNALFIPISACKPVEGKFRYRILTSDEHICDVYFYTEHTEKGDTFTEVAPPTLTVRAQISTDDIKNELGYVTPVDITTLEYYDSAVEYVHHINDEDFIKRYEEQNYTYINLYYEFIGTDKADWIVSASWNLCLDILTPDPAYYSRLFYVKDGRITEDILTAKGEIGPLYVIDDKMYFHVNSKGEESRLYCIEPGEDMYDKLELIDSGEKITILGSSATERYIRYAKGTDHILDVDSGEIFDTGYTSPEGYTEYGALIHDGIFYYPFDETKKYLAKALNIATGEVEDCEKTLPELHEEYVYNEKPLIVGGYTIDDIINPTDGRSVTGLSITNNETGEEKRYPFEKDLVKIGAIGDRMYYSTSGSIMELDPAKGEIAFIPLEHAMPSGWRINGDTLFLYSDIDRDVRYAYSIDR